MSTWTNFAVALLTKIEALNVAAYETYWAWSNAETAPYPLLRWFNPTNTTEPWPGAVDSGAQPGLHDVKIYASFQDGVDATAYTLLNEPYYGAIVANLRAGLPRQQWGLYSTAAAELHLWGTGSAWLARSYPGLPPSPAFGDSGNSITVHPLEGEISMEVVYGDLLIVLGRGTDESGGGIWYHRSTDAGTTFGPWIELGPSNSSELSGDQAKAVVHGDSGKIDVFMRGGDSQSYRISSGKDWGASWEPGWTATGGKFTGSLIVVGAPAPLPVEAPEPAEPTPAPATPPIDTATAGAIQAIAGFLKKLGLA